MNRRTFIVTSALALCASKRRPCGATILGAAGRRGAQALHAAASGAKAEEFADLVYFRSRAASIFQQIVGEPWKWEAFFQDDVDNWSRKVHGVRFVRADGEKLRVWIGGPIESKEDWLARLTDACWAVRIGRLRNAGLLR